jgi:hypothetical protein
MTEKPAQDAVYVATLAEELHNITEMLKQCHTVVLFEADSDTARTKFPV